MNTLVKTLISDIFIWFDSLFVCFISCHSFWLLLGHKWRVTFENMFSKVTLKWGKSKSRKSWEHLLTMECRQLISKYSVVWTQILGVKDVVDYISVANVDTNRRTNRWRSLWLTFFYCLTERTDNRYVKCLTFMSVHMLSFPIRNYEWNRSDWLSKYVCASGLTYEDLDSLHWTSL